MTGRDPDCVFCGIVAGARPARVVMEDYDTVAFLDIAPANPGHTLVVPRLHAADLFDATPEQVAAVARTARRVAHILRDRLGAEGVTLFQANGTAGWQDVFHLHVHVVPRHFDDHLRRPWSGDPADPGDLDATLRLLTR